MQKIIRTTSAPFEYMEGTEVKTKKITVRYVGRTVKELKEQRASIENRAKENPNQVVWLSESLAKRLNALEDLPEDFANLQITEEGLDELDVKNLEAIRDAIDENENPTVKKPTLG